MKNLFVVGLMAASGTVWALPALQLGPGAGSWSYCTTDCANEENTWVTLDSPTFSVNAYANATAQDGGNGDYGFDPMNELRRAYLVFAAVPDLGDVGDLFDITVSNDGGTLSLYDSGYGTPPVQDDNSIAGHGIFDTYFEIYQFRFDGSIGTITDTQPGTSDSGQGYTETFEVTVNASNAAVAAIHMDLFTVEENGVYDPTAEVDSNRSLVIATAPFSHDAEVCVRGPDCEPPVRVAEPTSVALLGLGLLGLGLLARYRRRS